MARKLSQFDRIKVQATVLKAFLLRAESGLRFGGFGLIGRQKAARDYFHGARVAHLAAGFEEPLFDDGFIGELMWKDPIKLCRDRHEMLCDALRELLRAKGGAA